MNHGGVIDSESGVNVNTVDNGGILSSGVLKNGGQFDDSDAVDDMGNGCIRSNGTDGVLCNDDALNVGGVDGAVNDGASHPRRRISAIEIVSNAKHLEIYSELAPPMGRYSETAPPKGQYLATVGGQSVENGVYLHTYEINDYRYI